MKYRLGLDVGTNSLGWAVLKIGEDEKPVKLMDAGARIFSDGRDPQSKATLKATRRAARMARRQRDRFLQRQSYLMNELTRMRLFPEYGEFPEAEILSGTIRLSARHCLQRQDPLKLRALGLNGPLAPYELGRALFHINRRRGFKSNRKTRNEDPKDSKFIAKSTDELLRAMELISSDLSAEEYDKLPEKEKEDNREKARDALKKDPEISFGAFLWKRQQKHAPTRARAGTDGPRPTRALLEDEFDKIMRKQQEHHNNLTDDKVAKLRKIIFSQRPLIRPVRGRCAFMYPAFQKRAYRAMPSIQLYRICQEVNGLKWETSEGEQMLIDREHSAARDAVMQMLEMPKKRKVKFSDMKKVIKRSSGIDEDFAFNYESPDRDGFDSNLASFLMQKKEHVGLAWHDWDLDKKDRFIALLLGYKNLDSETANDESGKEPDLLRDDEIFDILTSEYDLSDEAARACMKADLKEDEGTANLSLKAARLLIDKMNNKRMGQYEAVVEAAEDNCIDFVNPYISKKEKLRPCLPYYGDLFQDGRHIIPGKRDKKDKDAGDLPKFYGSVTNPTVHIALTQIRYVINELIARYGRPDSIAIELGREFPMGQEKLSKLRKKQAKNRRNNEEWDKKLEEMGDSQTRENRLLLRLWEEIDKRCPFSQDPICYADLFNGNVAIDHILPVSKTLDNTYANKILCTAKANHDKGNQTPFQAFGHSSNQYDWETIRARVKKLPQSKRWRFGENALEEWKGKSRDFTERHLNDARYIGRLAKDYLECICPANKIDVVTGLLTSELRKHWGLNSILDGAREIPKKNRNDHRHHAIDALVVGMTNLSLMQKVHTGAKETGFIDLSRMFPKDKNNKSAIDQWDGFRGEAQDLINKIVVSHRASQKKPGKLHEATAYGIVAEPSEDEPNYTVVSRWPIEKFTEKEHLRKIRNPELCKELLQKFHEGGKDAVLKFCMEKKIRRIRRLETKGKIVPISRAPAFRALSDKDKAGAVYKAYESGSNWAMELYELPDNIGRKSGKWEHVVISRFDANKPGFKLGEKKPHPDASLVMRLHINDYVQIKEKDKKKRLMRVQKIDVTGEIALAEHHEANASKRHEDRQDSFRFNRVNPDPLRKMNAKKAHVSHAGLVRIERRRRKRRS